MKTKRVEPFIWRSEHSCLVVVTVFFIYDGVCEHKCFSCGWSSVLQPICLKCNSWWQQTSWKRETCKYLSSYRKINNFPTNYFYDRGCQFKTIIFKWKFINWNILWDIKKTTKKKTTVYRLKLGLALTNIHCIWSHITQFQNFSYHPTEFWPIW